MSKTALMSPIHPGELLAEEYLTLGITQHKLAVDIGVPPRRINEIVHGKRRISADTAPARSLLRHVGAVLAEPARPLRPRNRTRPPRPGSRRHPPPAERLTSTAKLPDWTRSIYDLVRGSVGATSERAQS
jgi:addiction module antidote protein, HigA family